MERNDCLEKETGKNIYVLRDKLIYSLAKLGWYLNNFFGKVVNGEFHPSLWGKFVFILVYYRSFHNLTFHGKVCVCTCFYRPFDNLTFHEESLCLYLFISHWQLDTHVNTTLKCKLLVADSVVRFLYKLQNVLCSIKMWFKCDDVTHIILVCYVKFEAFTFLDYIKPKILNHHLKLNLIYLENQIWVLQKEPI